MFKDYPDSLNSQQMQRLLGIGKTYTLNLINNGYLLAMIIANSYRIKKKRFN